MYILYNFYPQFAYERLKMENLEVNNGFNHQWCKVRQDKSIPNGEVIDDYFVTIRPEVALILPVTSNQEIILVKYRHGAGEILLEPAGTFNPDEESPQAAAIRELKEETIY